MIHLFIVAMFLSQQPQSPMRCATELPPILKLGYRNIGMPALESEITVHRHASFRFLSWTGTDAAGGSVSGAPVHVCIAIFRLEGARIAALESQHDDES